MPAPLHTKIWAFLRPGWILHLLAALFLLFHWVETSLLHISFQDISDALLHAPTLMRIGGVTLAALLETIFVFGYYFPGSLVLFAGYFVFHDSPFFFAFAASTWSGVMLGCALNYHLGRKYAGLVDKLGHKGIIAKARAFIERFGPLGFIFLSAHPNYCGTSFLAMGLLRLPPHREFLITGGCGIVWLAVATRILWELPFTSTTAGTHAYYIAAVLFGAGIAISMVKHLAKHRRT